jgi:hypothetical protein
MFMTRSRAAAEIMRNSEELPTGGNPEFQRLESVTNLMVSKI